MSLFCLGLNHQSAPIDVLERISCNSSTLEDFLGHFKKDESIVEAAALSTCNRTEFYVVAADPVRGRDCVVQALVNAGKAIKEEVQSFSYTHRQDGAARHLFRVAAGIDSLIVGEAQILGQLRQAYELALGAGTVGGLLNSLMMRAISFGRKVRTTTAIGRGNVSVVSIAIRQAMEMYPDISDKTLMVIGAGQTAMLATQQFMKVGVTDLLIANRTCAHAEEVLRKVTTGRFVPIERLQMGLEEADIVVCAVGAPHHIITLTGIEGLIPQRKGRPLLFIDLSMPRNVDPKITSLEGVKLVALENLEEIAHENRQQRLAEIAEVEELIEHETSSFLRWTQTSETTRLITALRRHTEAVRQQHMRRFGKHLSDEARQEIEKFSDSLLRSVLHDVTEHIRLIDTAAPSGKMELEQACRLFNLSLDNPKE